MKSVAVAQVIYLVAIERTAPPYRGVQKTGSETASSCGWSNGSNSSVGEPSSESNPLSGGVIGSDQRFPIQNPTGSLIERAKKDR
jgi:hypothetical protein